MKPDTQTPSISREHCKNFLILLRQIRPSFKTSAKGKDLSAVVDDAMAASGGKRMAINTREMYFRQYLEFINWMVAEGALPSLNLTGLKVERQADDDPDNDTQHLL